MMSRKVGFKSVLLRGRCSATCPFSLIIMSIPAVATPPFLAENQMTMETLCFKHKTKLLLLWRSVQLFSLHCYESVEISVTSNIMFCPLVYLLLIGIFLHHISRLSHVQKIEANRLPQIITEY
jgi:hypothetical protein